MKMPKIWKVKVCNENEETVLSIGIEDKEVALAADAVIKVPRNLLVLEAAYRKEYANWIRNSS